MGSYPSVRPTGGAVIATIPHRPLRALTWILRDEHGEWLYWFELAGETGSGLSEERAIDRDHIAHAQRAKEPGHVTATPEVLLLPAPVEQAIRAWANHGSGSGSA